jgi:hypothetical protein
MMYKLHRSFSVLDKTSVSVYWYLPNDDQYNYKISFVDKFRIRFNHELKRMHFKTIPVE